MFNFGQVWESDVNPHEDFEIYGGIGEMGEEVWFWERVNHEAFNEFMNIKKGGTVEELIKQGKNTYPYAWAGECNSSALKAKIRKSDMRLAEEERGI